MRQPLFYKGYISNIELFNCFESVFQIGDDIVDMLGADRQADRIPLDALIR